MQGENGFEVEKANKEENCGPPSKRPRYSVIKKAIHLRKGVNDGVSESYTPSQSQVDGSSSQNSQMNL